MTRQKGAESLRQAVERLDAALWHQLEHLWRQAELGIHDAQRSKDGHQQGTAHCLAVEENLTALIPDDWKGAHFTATDLFILSAAAALHDAGKAGDLPGDHGHISMVEIRERHDAFGLDRGQAIAVGWIVSAHNKGDLEALPAGLVAVGAIPVSVRPLAALFKLADALHTDYRRVSDQVVEFGGKEPEDGKTRFRQLVTGWVFDADRILLQAAPEDWDDVAVIHTGFEMTRRELEPVVPTLRDAGLPWELALRLDETDLERKAELEAETERLAERAFPGMDYFAEADADHFKGRDGDAEALWHRVMAGPVTLLVGDSGVGKTSLIHAGLFPWLHRARWRTAYTRPFDEPDRQMVRGLWRGLPDLLQGEPPDGIPIVDALVQVGRLLEDHKLLVVLDQFEDVARLPLPAMLDGVRRAVVAVQAGRFHNLRLLVSYRADAEATLGPFFQEIAGSARGLPRAYLQPLSRAGARAALHAGFAEAQVGVSDALLDSIADELEAQTPTPGVYPPYVQMVGETLCRAALEQNDGVLTDDLLRAQEACAGIIGGYLLQRLAEFGEQEEAARQVLIALVRSTGVKEVGTLDELVAVTKLDCTLLARVVAGLVDKRMVRSLGGGRYEIIHDHLARLVDQRIDAEQRQLKELREFLDLKARAYAMYPVPLHPADMARLYATRQQIAPDLAQMRLLLHSSLLRQGPAWFWLRAAESAVLIPLLRDALPLPIARLRYEAVRLLAPAAGREAILDLRAMLADGDGEVRQVAARALAQVAGREAIPDLRAMLADGDGEVRQAAARALAQVAGREAIPDLRATLSDKCSAMRRAAVEALAQVAGPEAIPDMQAVLGDKDDQVREVAVQALANVAGREAILHLRAMLHDRCLRVRRAAVQALAKVAGPEAIPDLQDKLGDDVEEVNHAVAEALAMVVGREEISSLRAMLHHGYPFTRAAAVEALAQLAGREAIPDLRAMLADRDTDVRRAAAEALGKVVAQEAIPDLRTMRHDDYTEVRWAAAEALAKMAGRDEISDLRDMMVDWSPFVRRVAVEAVAKAASREAISDLRAMLADWSPYVRRAAVEALANVAGREAIPDLRAVLADEVRDPQGAAVEALARVAGPHAVADLRDMLADQGRDLREAAVEVLAREAGGEAVPDLRAVLTDGYSSVRAGAVEAFGPLLQEDDLDWLCDWVLRHPLGAAGEAANRLLIDLDRKLYCPYSKEKDAPPPSLP